MRSSLSYALFALVLFTVTWGLTASPRPDSGTVPALRVETLTIQPVLVRPQLTLSGRIEPWKSALLSAQVSAPVRSRLKQLGEPVREGELILQLDPEQAQLQTRQAEAALGQAQAGYARLQADLKHSQAQVLSQSRVAAAGLTSARAAHQKQIHLTRPQELAAARAEWQAARAQRDQNGREQQRFEMLWKEGAISDQDMERSRLALDLSQRREISARQSFQLAQEGSRGEDRTGAQANLQTAQAGWQLAQAGGLQTEALRHQLGENGALLERQQASLQESRLLLERHQIRAPFAGRVLEVLVERGDAVRPGTTLCRIGQIDRVKVRFDVPEQVRPQLRPHQAVQVQATSLPGQVFQGEIGQLGYQADNQSHTFPVEIVLSNPQQKLLPNMQTRLQLPVGPGQKRILVPVSSLAFDGGLSYVYVIENGQARRREVVVGPLQQGELVTLEEGLKAGDRLALQPFRLSPGLAVQPQ